MSPDEPRRIEMVLPTLTLAGMEVMVTDLAAQLAQRGHVVGVTCVSDASGPLAERLRCDGIRVSQVAAPGAWSNVSAPALRAHFARLQPDVVHVHSGCWGQAARAARQARVAAVVHTAHGLDGKEPWHAPYFKRWASWHTDAIVAVSREHQEHLVRVAGVPREKTRVIANGINVDRFAPGPQTGALHGRLGIDDRPLVGIVARFAPVKNHAVLLDAFARLVAAGESSADLVLIGEGDLRSSLEAQVARLGIAGRVHFAGLAADPAPWYRDLDVFVLSSDSEATSISILEAMASGLPVVATAVGGTPDLLDDGVGVLVPPRDPDALAAALGAVLADAGRRRTLGEAARRRAVARYGGAAMAEAYASLYAEGWQSRVATAAA